MGENPAPGRSLAELAALFFGSNTVHTYFFGEPADEPDRGFDAVLRAITTASLNEIPIAAARAAGNGLYPVALIKWRMRMRRTFTIEEAADVVRTRVIYAREYRFLGATGREGNALIEEVEMRLALRYPGELFREEQSGAGRQIICPLRRDDQLIEVRFGTVQIAAALAAA